MTNENPGFISRLVWPVSLAGLGLFIFALVALTGPGRIDIVDGQTRFEVGRSLVLHGDSMLRDESNLVWFIPRTGRAALHHRTAFPRASSPRLLWSLRTQRGLSAKVAGISFLLSAAPWPADC